jgi:short-subunit dehydrogenase
MINVNIFGLTILTKIFIESMKKRTTRSLIIGSGSVDGQLRFTNRVVYGATKSYVEAFYEGLNRDLNNKFDFTLIEIGPVKSDMIKHDMPFISSSDEFASECIKLVGKYKFIQGCKKHFILRFLLSLPIMQFISRKIDEKTNID